jgi:peptide/nickel transport system substrate-binding protein
MTSLSRREFAVLSAGAATSALALGFHEAIAEAPKRGGTVVIPLVGGTPRHLNPAVQSGIATAMPGTQIFASPLRFDDNWHPQPYLAKSWEMASDGKALTLKLVDGATFHDGKPVTSEDVAFSIMTIKKNHPFQQMFAPVAAVETPDAQTAVIKLDHPHPALLLALSPALCPILPKHVFGDGTDVKVHPANNAPVGSGPFRLVEFSRGEHIILERYEKFFLPERPLLDRVIIRIINDTSALVLAMERGEAHLLPFIATPRDIDRLGRQPQLAVTEKGYEGIGPLTWIAFNLLKEPLNDKRVRQAICYAIDREFVLKRLLLGRAKAATGPIAPGTPFYTDDVEKYAVNLDKANQLLDEAGQKRNAHGVRFSLAIDYIPGGGSEALKTLAEYLRPQLKKVGIDVQVRTSPDFPTWAQRVGSWDFDMTVDVVFNWGDPVIGVDRTYLSSSIRKGVIWSNTQNYSNPRVDELLTKAAVETDEAKRRALYVEFQKIVVDDAPISYSSTVPYQTVYNKDLGGIPTTIWGAMSPMDELHWVKPPV